MSQAMLKRLKALEQREERTDALALIQHYGETWADLRNRADDLMRGNPLVKWLEPLLIGRRSSQ